MTPPRPAPVGREQSRCRRRVGGTTAALTGLVTATGDVLPGAISRVCRDSWSLANIWSEKPRFATPSGAGLTSIGITMSGDPHHRSPSLAGGRTLTWELAATRQAWLLRFDGMDACLARRGHFNVSCTPGQLLVVGA
jgi:hypothetical protein